MFRLAPLVCLVACATPAPRRASSPVPAAPAPAPLLNLVVGSSPRPPRILEGLAISLPSKWVPVGGVLGNLNTSFVVRSGDTGPYEVVVANEFARIEGPAHVVRLTGFPTLAYGRIETNAAGIEILPIDVVPVLDDATARWTAFLAEQAAAIESALADTNRLSSGRPFGVETTTTADLFAPTWDPAAQAVSVTFLRTLKRTSATAPQRFGCGPGYRLGNEAPAPCEPSAQGPPQRVRTYTVEIALAIHYAADGSVTATKSYPPVGTPTKGPF